MGCELCIDAELVVRDITNQPRSNIDIRNSPSSPHEMERDMDDTKLDSSIQPPSKTYSKEFED